MASQGASAVPIDLFEWALKIDSAFYGTGVAPPPANVNPTGFDFSSGLGTLSTRVTGAGAHFVGWYLDHEIDQAVNLWYNETGSETGTPAAGQSWEIDEPGYGEQGGSGPYYGDIYGNLDLSDATGTLLDNQIFVNYLGDSISGPDDVSMAMGWDFLLGVSESAVISLTVSETAPSGGFYLTQTDPDSNASIYMYGNLSVRAIPAPATLLLTAIGLVGVGGIGRRSPR